MSLLSFSNVDQKKRILSVELVFENGARFAKHGIQFGETVEVPGEYDDGTKFTFYFRFGRDAKACSGEAGCNPNAGAYGKANRTIKLPAPAFTEQTVA